VIPATDIPTYKIKKNGAKIQVEVDVNYKLDYESNYWRGILDAQVQNASKTCVVCGDRSKKKKAQFFRGILSVLVVGFLCYPLLLRFLLHLH